MPPAQPIDAVLTAGGIPGPDDPLYPLTQGKSKALLPIGGRPMTQWVLDALDRSQSVRRVVVVGLSPADQALLTGAKVTANVPNQGSLLGNVEAGAKKVLEQQPDAKKALLVSSDIPCLTPAMVDWMVDTCLATDHEVYYGLISQDDMERRFPGSNRTYFALKEGRFCGSDIIVVATSLVGHYHPGWNDIVGARKNIFKQASLVGFDTLLLMLLRQMSIPEAERRAQTKLGIRGRILRCPYAESGMDVDKPHQYDLVKRDLEARAIAG
jgi:CTP:molybdopterin cytidylyltransferase MocA